MVENLLSKESGKLNLVDLAGFLRIESIRCGEQEGSRAGMINQSFVDSFCRVINAL